MLNKAVSDFALPGTGGKTFRLSESSAGLLVIYFYPKDNTPGCTTEGQNFRDLYPQFQKLNCAIFGVSRDSLQSHENFKSKMSFPFELLSDADEEACKLFAVIKMKNTSSPNQLLSDLVSVTEVHGFFEQVPNMSEIFISLVKGASHE